MTHAGRQPAACATTSLPRHASRHRCAPCRTPRSAGEGTAVELADLRSRGSLLDPAANDIELPLEGFLVDTLGIGNQDLLDLGPRRVGLLAENADIDRHMPPAIDRVTHPENLGFDDGAAGLLRTEFRSRQKNLAHCNELVLPRLMTGAPHLVMEDRHWILHVDAGPVTGLAVRIDGAPVPHRLQGDDSTFDDRTRRLAVNRDDDADASGRAFEVLRIESVFRHPLAARGFGGRPSSVVHGHMPPSSENLAMTSASVMPCNSPANAYPSGRRSV